MNVLNMQVVPAVQIQIPAGTPPGPIYLIVTAAGQLVADYLDKDGIPLYVQ
jgi:hypothetical protein